MIFGRKNISTFGNIKVVKWNNSIFTDFDRKNISARGIVLASCEVPTIRKITAQILAIASSAYDIHKKVQDVCNWLNQSGQNKLISSRDLNHYYKARCTAVSIPQYSGFTAKFTATFQCSDFRLYNVHSNSPVSEAVQSMNNFTFNGKHCLNDMNCVFVLERFDAVPRMSISKYQISGSNGTLRFDSKFCATMQQRQLIGTLYFVKNQYEMSLMSDTEIHDRISKIAQWLVNSKRADFIFDARTDVVYQAQVQDSIQFNRKEWDNGCVKLKMKFQPIGKSTQRSFASMNNESVNAGRWTNYPAVSESIDSEIGFETPLVVSIWNTGTQTITGMSVCVDEHNWIHFNGNGFNLAPNERIVIDGQNNDVYKVDGQSCIMYLNYGDFLTLKPNVKPNVGILSDATTKIDMAIQYNKRWM